MANVKLSAIASGAAANSATDTMVAVRNGTTDVLVSVGNLISVTAAAGVAAFLATPTSANLLAAVTDETGTGVAVFNNGPTLIAPALGTPASGVATNLTGTAAGLTAGNVTTNANLTGAITSSGNATSLGSFTSAQLATALTDETGTGANVFANTPTLVTPVLGAATGTSLQLSGLTASSALATDGSKNLVSVTNTGSGNNVLATSPTLTTPNISQINAPTSAGTQIAGITSGSNIAAGNIGEILSINISASGNNLSGTATMTIAAPCVVTLAAHGLLLTQAVYFTTSGALPTGLAVNTTYYAVPINSSTFNLATSVDNALAGILITTTGSQSGTHTLFKNAFLTSASYVDVCGLQLTAGIWSVYDTPTIFSNTSSVVTGYVGGISLASATPQTPLLFVSGVSFTNPNFSQSLGPKIINVSGITTIYAIQRATWTVGQVTASSSITAIRIG